MTNIDLIPESTSTVVPYICRYARDSIDSDRLLENIVEPRLTCLTTASTSGMVICPAPFKLRCPQSVEKRQKRIAPSA